MRFVKFCKSCGKVLKVVEMNKDVCAQCREKTLYVEIHKAKELGYCITDQEKIARNYAGVEHIKRELLANIKRIKEILQEAELKEG